MQRCPLLLGSVMFCRFSAQLLLRESHYPSLDALSIQKTMRLLLYMDRPQPPPLFNPVLIGTGSAMLSGFLAVNLSL